MAPEEAWLVVAQVELHKETQHDPAEEHAGLRLVVGDETHVGEELGEIQGGCREAAELGHELEELSAEVLSVGCLVTRLTCETMRWTRTAPKPIARRRGTM